ncbi:DsbA family protein [Ornithinimicrobium pratense]|uniref:Thioredoxin domain-containing protein n=1 Tax=Ornithinimicrobium pratense TaxID=2593973 RepID=A0A5J6V4Q9_9MICO|nr:thioredoxin domain-containing protein [Ornithinimicrobium pratense]QFG68765.1 thioredoxin domain-containing protein [Ornithinimicrobium pratense]
MPRPPAPQVKPVSSKGPPGVLIGAVVVLVLALIAGLVWAATRDGADLSAEGSANALPEGGGISLGPDPEAGIPKLHVYGDFQCPWCGVLEDAIGESVQEKVEAGETHVTVTLMSFLDGRVPGENSVRAANAALCADDQDVFLPYYHQVYVNRPAEEGSGWTDDQLVSFAGAAGIEGDDLDTFTSCLEDRSHVDYVHAMQERANRDGVSGTPRLFVDGTQITDEQMQGLMENRVTLDQVVAAHS